MFTRIAASARRSIRSLQIAPCVPSDDSAGDYDLKMGSGSVVPRRGPKSRALGKAAQKQRGGGQGKDCNTGKLGMLTDMPFDVLYDVSCRTIPTEDGI